MGDRYETLPHNKIQQVSEIDENGIIQKILIEYLPYLKTEKITPDQLIELESLYELTKNLTIKCIIDRIKCLNCNKNCEISHDCLAGLCKECVALNKFCCLKCKKKIDRGYLMRMFGYTGKCDFCDKELEMENCKNICVNCLMNEGFHDQNCLGCHENLDEFKYNIMCEGCKGFFSFREEFMVKICGEHYFCGECADTRIKKSKCSCGRKLSTKEIYSIFKRIYDECKNCNKDILKINSCTRECCGIKVCNKCFAENCTACTESINSLVVK